MLINNIKTMGLRDLFFGKKGKKEKGLEDKLSAREVRSDTGESEAEAFDDTEREFMAQGEDEARNDLQARWEETGSLDLGHRAEDNPDDAIGKQDKFTFVVQKFRENDNAIKALATEDVSLEDKKRIKEIAAELSRLDKDQASLEVLYQQYFDVEKLTTIITEVREEVVKNEELGNLLAAYLEHDLKTRAAWDVMRDTGFSRDAEAYTTWMQEAKTGEEMWDKFTPEMQQKLLAADINRKEGGNQMREMIANRSAGAVMADLEG